MSEEKTPPEPDSEETVESQDLVARLSVAPSAARARDLVRKLQGQSNFTDRYEVHEEIGRGGMGVVRRVRDRDLERNQALKCISTQRPIEEPETPADHLRLIRFLEEAQVTGTLDHPGVVPVHELGVDDEGRPYFTMKYVRGEDLGDVFRSHRRQDGAWTMTRCVGLILKVSEAVAYAHDKGVLHRDLKPSNIRVGRYGEVYVMDWGLARVQGRPDLSAPSAESIIASTRSNRGSDESEADLHTEHGAALGTLFYMAPEQARGEVDAVGAHSDVYSMGAILYELLTGRPPFHAANQSAAELLERVQTTPAEPVRSLEPQAPSELVAIAEKAMSPDPAARYAGMGELTSDLRSYLEGRVVRAHGTGALRELRKWMIRNRGAAAAMALTLLLLLVTAGATFEIAQAKELELNYDKLRVAERELAVRNRELETSKTELEAAVGALSTTNRKLNETTEDLGEAQTTLRTRVRDLEQAAEENAELTGRLEEQNKQLEEEKKAVEESRRRALESEEQLRRVRDFLVSLFGTIDDPEGPPATVSDLLTYAVERSEALEELAEEDAAAIQFALGLACIEARDHENAEKLLDAAEPVFTGHDNHRMILRTALQRARITALRAQPQLALRQTRDVLRRHDETGSEPRETDPAVELGIDLLVQAGEYEAAWRLSLERSIESEDVRLLARICRDLFLLDDDEDDPSSKLPTLRASARELSGILGRNHEGSLRVQHQLGRQLILLWDFHGESSGTEGGEWSEATLEEAERVLDDCARGYASSLGPKSHSNLLVLRDLAGLAERRGHYDRSVELFRQALRGFEARTGELSKDALATLAALALLQHRGQDLEEAATCYETLARRQLDNDDLDEAEYYAGESLYLTPDTDPAHAGRAELVEQIKEARSRR